MDDRQKIIPVLLICGGLWGGAEATLGYLLHLLPSGFSGLLMFPIGFYFMMNAYLATQRRSAIILIAVVAAGIKLIDLALPVRSPMSVINPAGSIILESLVVIVFASQFKEKRVYSRSILMGLSWVILLIAAQAFIFKPSDGLYLKVPVELLFFIGLNAFVSGGLIGFYLKRPRLNISIVLQRRPFFMPTLIILLAVICEMVNSLI